MPQVLLEKQWGHVVDLSLWFPKGELLLAEDFLLQILLKALVHRLPLVPVRLAGGLLQRLLLRRLDRFTNLLVEGFRHHKTAKVFQAVEGFVIRNEDLPVLLDLLSSLGLVHLDFELFLHH